MSSGLFLRRGDQVTGPFPLPVVKRKVKDGSVLLSDQVGQSEDGPWRRVKAIPSLTMGVTQEEVTDEWDEVEVESEAYVAPVKERKPTAEPVTGPSRAVLLWCVSGVVVLVLVSVVGGIYLTTQDQPETIPQVSSYDAKVLRERAAEIAGIALVLDSAQTWLKDQRPDVADVSMKLSAEAEVPGLRDQLTTLKEASTAFAGTPDVGRECQRLVSALEGYELLHGTLSDAVAEFAAASPTSIPFDSLQKTIEECRELGVPLLKARADMLSEVLAAAQDDDATFAELMKLEEFEFQTVASQRPSVTDGTEEEFLALAKFFVCQRIRDAVVVARDKIKHQEVEATRDRNQLSTSKRSLYLVDAESYADLEDRHGSRTVVRWHGQSPTYFVPSQSGDPQDFRTMASALGLLLESSSDNALEVRMPLDMLSRLKKWLDARRLEKDAADKAGEQEGRFLASTNVKRVLAQLRKQVYFGFGDPIEDGSYEWSSLMCAGTLRKSSTNGQEAVFLDVERVIVTRFPCRATALANRAAIGLSGHVVTREREFDVPVMNDVIVSPLAMATLGLEASHLVPPTEQRAGMLREEYMETIVRGDEIQIRQSNKTIRDWFRAAIDQRNLVLPEQNALEERIRPIVKSAQKSQLTRLARILRLGAGMRLYGRSTSILGGSSRIREDVASAAFSDDSLRRVVPAPVVKLFEEQILQPRVVLAVSSDGVWIVTGREAVSAVRKLFDVIGFNGDQKKEKLALSQASAFYTKFTPTIRRPVIPPPPSDPLYPRKGPMPRPPRGGSKTTTVTVVSVPRSRTGDALTDAVLTRGALDAAKAAAKIGDQRLLRLVGGRTDTVTVRNKKYAGDAAWARYRAKVRLVQRQYSSAVSGHQQRIVSGAYNSNPVWIRYQSELSAWNKKKDETIAAWQKLSADLLSAWKGGRQRSVLTTINDLRRSRREQLGQIQKAADALRSGSGQPKSPVGTEPMPKRPVHLIPSLAELLAR